MFGSEILETMIGMIFIYLTLSIIVSSAQEVLESLLRMRATLLARGLRQMFGAGDMGTNQLLEKVLNQPLMAAVRGKTSAAADAAKLTPPSYLAPGVFAMAVLDALKPGGGTTHSGTSNCYAWPGTTPTPVPPPPPPPPGVMAVPAPPTSPMATLRQALVPPPALVVDGAHALPATPDPAMRTLLALADAAGDDVQRFRELIEEWFKSGMDRVSGWYRQYARLVIFLLGLGIAIGLNADTLTLIRYLSQHKETREKLVTMAEKAASQPPPTTMTTTQTKPTTPTPPPTTPVTQSTTPTTHPTTPTTAATDKKSEEFADVKKLREELEAVQQFGLPLGWGEANRPSGWGWVSSVIGWLLTACAISLGAPFWFDLLNRFINFRSALKPADPKKTTPPAGSGAGGPAPAGGGNPPAVAAIATAGDRNPPARLFE